jgi:succinate dehydrogenase / fumarate reductase cytochrome b subunit
MSQKYHNLARRLHSFTGIFPVGIFLCVHLFINSFIFKGPEAYNEVIALLEKPIITPFLEIFLIGVPLAYHALYGLWVTYVTKTNLFQYKYFRNWMFYLQRVTAVITFFFVVWHVYVLRISRIFTGTEMNYDIISMWLSDPTYFVIYLIGYLAAIFHFSNGLWSFLVSWGITIGEESQRFVTYVCALIFIVIGAAGIGGLAVLGRFFN